MIKIIFKFNEILIRYKDIEYYDKKKENVKYKNIKK